DKRQAINRIEVCFHKKAAHVMIPLLDLRDQLFDIFFPNLVAQEKAAVCRVMERPDHSGYITQRGIFQSPLAITPCRLAFEINNQKIFSGKQYLSEVVVAVYPNFGDINFMMVDLLKQLKEL